VINQTGQREKICFAHQAEQAVGGSSGGRKGGTSPWTAKTGEVLSSTTELNLKKGEEKEKGLKTQNQWRIE